MLTQHKRKLVLLAVICCSALFAITSRISAIAHAANKQQTSWTLVWSDEFNGSGAPSSTNWNYHVGNGFNPGAATFDGWGNGEWEWYRPENCYQSGGNLVLKGEYRTAATTIAGRQWYQFSCRITSDSKRSIQYGAIEARVQMPNVYGTWPAFWMMGDACDDTSTSNYSADINYYDRMASNWASCGEVDIFEHRNTESIIFHNLFWDTRTGLFPWDGPSVANNPTQYNLGDVSQFHTYRLEWTSTQLKWMIDGVTTKTQDISAGNMEEFRQPFHIIMNLAISGAFTGNAQPNQASFPTYMNVDYLRVYQAGSTPPPPPPGNLALNKPASGSASCNTNETPAKAVNGSVSGGNSDKFCSGATPKWLQVDLGSNYNVNQVIVRHAGAGGESTSYNTRDFNIQVSADNVNWTTISTVTGNTANVSTLNVTGTGRYVKLNITQAEQTNNNAARIYELEVYGTPASGSCTGDFSQGVTNNGATSGLVWFKPCGYTAGYVILHYTRPGLAQQNVNMSYNSGAGQWEYNVTGLSVGQTLQYQFTYQKNGLQYDSASFSWVHP